LPIYEYHCNQCDHDFEYLVFNSQEPETCPSCDSSQVARQMSVCGFVSKGVGGETVSSSASANSCGGCTASSCASCGH